MQRQVDPKQDWRAMLHQAEQCQTLLAAAVPSGSFERYRIVLEELRREAARALDNRRSVQVLGHLARDKASKVISPSLQRQHNPQSVPVDSTVFTCAGDLTTPAELCGTSTNLDATDLPHDDSWQFLGDVAGWADFDSLVSGIPTVC